MEDKEKGEYNSWTQDEMKVLIELLVEGIKRGWRDFETPYLLSM